MANYILAGGGEMGALMRRFDWSATSIGPMEGWPASLKTAVNICLGSRYPIVIWWGNPAYTTFYNDAYIPFLGVTKHPRWLGQSGWECWSEIWPTIGPMLESVCATGEATWSEDLLFVLDRNLSHEEGYFTFSYSAIRDDRGAVGGIFCACNETTSRVHGERQLTTLRDLGRRVAEARTADEACEVAAQTLGANPSDIPFALIYLLDAEGKHARQVAATGVEPMSRAAPDRIALMEPAGASAGWPLGRVFHTGAAELVPDLVRRFGPLPGGAWPEPPDSALVLPINAPGQPRPTGFLVAGLSPRRVVTADYRSFFDLVAGHVATAVANARAHEAERRRAEALAELDRAKTAFFSKVSHEFRTPLTLVLGPLEDALARGEGQVPSSVREEIVVAHRNSLRLLKLVNSLLDFARIEAGRVQASYEPTDLAALATDLASVFRWLPDQSPAAEAPLEALDGNLALDGAPLTFGPGAGAESDGARILLADDNADMRDYMRRLLSPRYDVVAVADGHAALAAAREQTPDLVLTDAMMPGLDGLGLLTALRADPRTRTVPVLLLSARVGEEARVEGLQAGADDYLTKPFSARELLARVRTHLEMARLRREADATLRQSEERARLALDVARLGTWSWDPSRNELLADARCREISGLDPEAALTFADVIPRCHPDDRPRIEAALRAAHQPDGDGRYAEEYRLVHPDGSVRWIVSRGQTLFVREGDARRCGLTLGTVLDVTERRRAEEVLRESEARFRQMADNISQFAWMADAKGWIFWYNRRWFDYTGTTLEQMQGWGWRQVHHPDHVDRVVARLQQSWDSGEPWEDTFPLRGKDGGYRWFLSRALPIRDPEGRVVRWFGTNTDVTEQREMEQALKDADRRKDEFLAMLAHELRNPLGAVSHALLLLRMSDTDQPAAERALGVLERQVKHQSRLVEDLLDASRITRGKIQLRQDRVDLARIARETAEDYRSAWGEAGPMLRLELTEQPVWVVGDPTRLSQILSNLLQNAMKFTDAAGHVTVRLAVETGGELNTKTRRHEERHTKEDSRGETSELSQPPFPDASPSPPFPFVSSRLRVNPDRAVITVTDTGVGIEPEMLPRLFETFTQADRSLDRSRGGLGLGLALVKGLVELHGGEVRVRSDGLGRGAEFTLLLPTAAAPPEAVPAPAAGPMRSWPARILIVEDNRDAAAVLRDLLEQSGCTVAAAYSGSEALEVALPFRPEVVLCDLGLPGMDGYQVATALRREPITARSRLIAISGYGQEEDQRRAREAGFDLHLTKPVDFADLERLLRTG